MEHLDSRSINTLLNAVREIYSDLNPASLPDTIVRSASRVIPCGSVGHTRVPRKNPQILPEAMCCTYPMVAWDVFNAHVHEHPFMCLANMSLLKLHPLAQDVERALSRLLGSFRKVRLPAALKISDVLTTRQFHSLTVFNEFFRLNGIEYQLGGPIAFHRDHAMTLCFNRAKADFTEKERTLRNLFTPHVVQAYKNAEVVAKLRNVESGAGKVLLEGKAKDIDPDAMKAMGITLREAEILHWISQGKTNAEISDILKISLNTVKTHQQHIYEKLGVENRVGAVRVALGNA